VRQNPALARRLVAGVHQLNLDVSGLAAGVYVVRVEGVLVARWLTVVC
jgi:hypothetical protein